MSNEQSVALITGSAKRIGAALVRRFHNAGYRLIIHFNASEEEALSLQAERNAVRADSVSCLQAALTKRSEVAQLARNALDCFGRIDVLINNASSFYATPLEDSTQEQWDDLVDSNLRGAYFLSMALSSELTRRQGNIINILDAMVDGAIQDFPIYNIAKAGLKSMTLSLAKELAPAVRVNGVAPGAILWPSHLENPQDKAAEAARKKALAGIPLGRTGTAEDIANTTFFLVDQASYMTGAVIKVDGGRALR